MLKKVAVPLTVILTIVLPWLFAFPYAFRLPEDIASSILMRPSQLLLLVLLLLTIMMVTIGWATTNRLFGILMDERNRMTLARLQLIAWTVLILSSFYASVLTNIQVGKAWTDSSSPISIKLSTELWLLMGISTASLIGSGYVLGLKEEKKPDDDAMKKSEEEINARRGIERKPADDTKWQVIGDTKQIGRSTIRNRGLVVENIEPSRASLMDIFMGDELGNFARVDVSKVQLFVFTFLIVLAYGTAVAAALTSATAAVPITALPTLDSSIVFLLALSHAGYLTYKAQDHTPTQ